MTSSCENNAGLLSEGDEKLQVRKATGYEDSKEFLYRDIASSIHAPPRL